MGFHNVLLKIGFLDLNERRMKVLVSQCDEEMIRWAFKNGKYDVRKLAVEYFAEGHGNDADLFLRTAMYDETEIVSQAAMSAMEKLNTFESISEEIADKRQYWMDEHAYRENRRNREHRKTSVLTESKERGSKKTLDHVRNMLRKPIGSGKWF